jgi:molybdopterin-guanine dinucleotide biosynthesis protein A
VSEPPHRGSPASVTPALGVVPPAIGIFVGGKGLRMGGVAKANLLHQGRTILERTLDCCAVAWNGLFGANVSPCIYLVGESSAYAASGVQRIADEPSGVGPMGGLRAFSRALPRDTSGLVIAGDLPFLTVQLIARLATEAPAAAALAPREVDGRWQPLFARYLPEIVSPLIDATLASGETSLQRLFARLGARAQSLELSTSEREQLRDWDRPCDVISGCPNPPK